MSAWRFRAVAVLAVAALALWLPWAFHHVDPGTLWLGIPFLGANVLLAVSLLVTLANNWQRAAAEDYEVLHGAEPTVAVIVPTAGESPPQVRHTVRSVLDQDWPWDRLVLVVSDDAWSGEMRAMVGELSADNPGTTIAYHRPPPRGSEEREGDAKAGNLNSALQLLDEITPDVEYVETRDADDLVGDPEFLRRCIAQFLADEDVAYVQTIKEARVSRGDPFDNLQPHFFRGAMFARHAANAVFPCGSGLVWRRSALEDIGRFPTWNLVEDLQSGVEALRRGWRGSYLPIVGAVGQHAPEDLANVYKQRGTWALDTMRLLVWGRLKGLNFRQRLQFLELGLFYLQSFATIVFISCPVIGFATGSYPLLTGSTGYALHFWPFAIAVELYFAALTAGVSYERIWRARVIWMGLAPVYAKACVLAILGGPRRKPTYRVTRKHDDHRWYWRQALPQMLMLGLLVGAMVNALRTESILYRVDLGSLYWATIFALALGCFIPRSWYGVRRRRRSLRSQRRTAEMGALVRLPLRPPPPLQPAAIGHDDNVTSLAEARDEKADDRSFWTDARGVS
jgi:cellulose synthase (UDP-forming)